MFTTYKQRLLTALGLFAMVISLALYQFAPSDPFIYFTAALLLGLSAVLNINTLLLYRRSRSEH